MSYETSENMGRVSLGVVIPTYNRPDHVRRAVYSALRSRVIREVIVVDDASPQPVDLSAIAVRRASRLQLIRHEKNQGVCAARNTGTHAARASHLLYLDDDDTLFPWAGFLLQRWIKQTPTAVSVGGIVVARPGSRPSLRRPPNSMPGEIWGLDSHLNSSGFSINTKQAAAIPKALVTKIGGWDEALRTRSSSEFFYRLTAVAQVVGHRWPIYKLNRGSHEKLTADPAARRISHSYIRDKHSDLLTDPLRRAQFEATHNTMMARTQPPKTSVKTA